MTNLNTLLLFCDDPMTITTYDDFGGDPSLCAKIKRFILSSKEDPDVGLASYDKGLALRLILSLHPPGSRVWFSTYEAQRRLIRHLRDLDVEHYITRTFRYERIVFKIDSPQVIDDIGWPTIYGFAGTDLYVFEGPTSSWEKALDLKGDSASADMWDLTCLDNLCHFLDEGLSYIHSYGGEEDDLAVYTKMLSKDKVIRALQGATAEAGIALLIIESAGERYWQKKRTGKI